jgi:hypothetical protein
MDEFSGWSNTNVVNKGFDASICRNESSLQVCHSERRQEKVAAWNITRLITFVSPDPYQSSPMYILNLMN